MRPEIRVDGLDLVLSNLRRVSSGYRNERRRIHQALGRSLLQRARDRARVDTGAMRGSLRLMVSTDEFDVETGVDYAHFQHYGTRFVSPNPFLTGPLQEMENEMVDDYQRMTDQFVDRVWRDS